MDIISPQEYRRLAGAFNGSAFCADDVQGYAALPAQLLTAEQSVAAQSPSTALILNKTLCRTMLDHFKVATCWTWPEQFQSLYQQQLLRIEHQLSSEPDDYFSFSNDPFRKDLAILCHRLLPFGAELATPYSGVSRSLLIKAGWQQAGKFARVMAACRGIKPFLELHMHPHDTATFNPEGWIKTYENLADFLVLNPSFLGVQSTSWFLDPALDRVSPHLSYLRQIPERCGAAILYAGEEGEHSGAFARSKTRRELYQAGSYQPRLFTRIWPRQQILRRAWRVCL